MDGSCSHCKHMSIAMLRSWLSFIMRLPLDSTQSGSSGHKDNRVCPATGFGLESHLGSQREYNVNRSIRGGAFVF